MKFVVQKIKKTPQKSTIFKLEKKWGIFQCQENLSEIEKILEIKHKKSKFKKNTNFVELANTKNTKRKRCICVAPCITNSGYDDDKARRGFGKNNHQTSQSNRPNYIASKITPLLPFHIVPHYAVHLGGSEEIFISAFIGSSPWRREQERVNRIRARGGERWPVGASSRRSQRCTEERIAGTDVRHPSRRSGAGFRRRQRFAPHHSPFSRWAWYSWSNTSRSMSASFSFKRLCSLAGVAGLCTTTTAGQCHQKVCCASAGREVLCFHRLHRKSVHGLIAPFALSKQCTICNIRKGPTSRHPKKGVKFVQWPKSLNGSSNCFPLLGGVG